ncbi:hypothetical protein ATANTOWER_009838 [Ataeniobius toweri]|uniref:Uncharacterized protein n=1 Tax=Ataeniobius toweri TaxID=208326 RepID=A0ABU7BPB2_9TELE|nr:hypothetical protein [Ataeniobius toweri]
MLLGTIPCRSSRESPFLSWLQPCDLKITSRKHQTFAHLQVHPPTPHAQLKCCHSEDHKVRESVLRTSMTSSCLTQPLGKLISFYKPSSTTNSEQTSLLSCKTSNISSRTKQ